MSVQIYSHDKAKKDFDGTNGVELSIKKWASVVAYLENVKRETLTTRQRLFLDEKTSYRCGLCFEHTIEMYAFPTGWSGLDCNNCPIGDGVTSGDCCEEFRDFIQSLRYSQPWIASTNETLALARIMLEKIKNVQPY